ncbi:unnamed protein product [Lepidochelys olivacea]
MMSQRSPLSRWRPICRAIPVGPHLPVMLPSFTGPLLQHLASPVFGSPFSDHDGLCAERLVPAYWHFNNSLLEDVGFVASFREFWLAWRGQRHAFPLARQWWDLGIVRARLFCRDYTRGASRQRDVAIGQLEWEVLELERYLASSPEDPFL